MISRAIKRQSIVNILNALHWTVVPKAISDSVRHPPRKSKTIAVNLAVNAVKL